ncbi:IPT/TIG domain-containing protein [Candidatus Saccharibacteria bacterium]|nr:IPT/TIG domain-containing protein [Candidatus Saccharibacteria bacterium]
MNIAEHARLKKSNINGLRIKSNPFYSAPAISLGVFTFAFLLTFLASSSFTPVQDSNAEDIAAVLNSSGYFINLTSANSGTVAMDVIGTAAGTVGMAKDTINIKSNAPSGYDLYLSMDNKDTDGNRLYKDANPGTAANPNPFLSPTSGTFSNPAALDTNSWGYALSSTTPGLPASNGGTSFDETYNVAVPSDTALFAGVPLQGNEQLIQSITTPDATNGIDTDIYYGVKVNTTLPSGSYKGTITYTAIAKTNSSINEQTSISPSVTTKLEGGETLTIATMLNIDANDAEDPGKEVSVTIGGEPCTNIQLSNAQDGSLTISCTSPSMATGRYDVGIDIPKYDKFWVIVNGIQYKYSEQDQQTAISQVTGGNATTTDILNGKTAYVNGVEILGSMPSFTAQYDTNKTAEQNTQDAGLTWSNNGNTLTISEGYHTQQQVERQGGSTSGDFQYESFVKNGQKPPTQFVVPAGVKQLFITAMGVSNYVCTPEPAINSDAHIISVHKYATGTFSSSGAYAGSYASFIVDTDGESFTLTVSNSCSGYNANAQTRVSIAYR